MTWAPGEPVEIKDRLIADGGWIERTGLPRLQPVSAADRRSRSPAMPTAGSITSSGSTARRRRPHRALVRAPGAAPAREDQPRAGARRQAGHRQGHAARAGQARGRPLEFHRGVAAAGARPLQRLPQVGDPARQRGARPRRVRPLRLLRSHEEHHRGAARRAAGRREEPAANTRSRTSAASSSPPTTRPTASICRPTTAAISSRGPTSTRATSRRLLERPLALVRAAAGSRSSPTTCRTSTSPASTRRHRRRRPSAFFEIVNASRTPENPGKLNFGSATGGSAHLAGEMFRQMAGIEHGACCPIRVWLRR